VLERKDIEVNEHERQFYDWTQLKVKE